MKKIQLLVLSASLFTFSALNSANAAPMGSVNFTGSIVDTLCTLTSGDHIDVSLGPNLKSSLDTVGKRTPLKDVVLNLEGCPASTATITFGGTADTTDSALLALTTGAGVATGVAVALFESDGLTAIPLGQPSAQKTLTTGVNSWPFKAAYQAVSIPVVVGTANATATFEIAYN